MIYYVTCTACKWVHFSRSLAAVTDEVNRFNQYFDTLDDKTKGYFGGKPSSIKHYLYCHRCGGSYTKFRPSTNEEIPNGSTINPILHYDEVLDGTDTSTGTASSSI